MPLLKLSSIPSNSNNNFDLNFPSDTESWTSSTPSSPVLRFETPRTTLTAELTEPFEDLGQMSASTSRRSLSRASDDHHMVPAGMYRILSAINPNCSLDLSGYDNESIIDTIASGTSRHEPTKNDALALRASILWCADRHFIIFRRKLSFGA
ncbi:hypothetical protein CVT24_013402 [Panaeolus cyanescens]|uniref:Uncharacterized protein n=1 Tax=Panaeolus cyanescens TaxID=181874 RepID=A0A409YMN1_9AGAR|nr:hypothetical protein CVT24_013402 [Panaeolus cyanescens]